ncbi:MAG: hypothetical protein L0332_23525 [Chloroflexi bacterium]|nr:hypothetical protein [Chloroflexota bacterium]
MTTQAAQTRRGPNTRQIVSAGEQASVGIAGLDTSGLNGVNRMGTVGVAGNLNGGVRTDVAAALRNRDAGLAEVTWDSNRLGDQAARQAWERGVWFADFTYITTPYEETENGGYVPTGGGEMRWRNGREATFGRPYRSLPLLIDCCGYRRDITGTAPQWAHDFDVYPRAIELIQPDGYAAWDHPTDRKRTLDALHEMMRLFPADVITGRMWPVFSIRWVWDAKAHLSLARLPGWASKNLAALIPINKTQKPFKEETRERWARQAIANALAMGADPDFRWMVEKFGRVMIGGMVGSECPRMARHIFAAVLGELFPGAQFWLLGQANFAVINGLGMLGLLDRIWSDGTWWIKDATAERFAYVEDGLITMHSFETQENGNGTRWRRQTFFTLIEMMAANLRSLLAAYSGMWTWPPPEPLPLDLLDPEQVGELKRRYHAAQLELGL